MTDQQDRTHEVPRRGVRPVRSVLDRLLVVSRHWFAAGTVFGLVFGTFFVKTLLSDVTFEASATIAIETSPESGGVLADLAALSKPSKVETEMEVLRSYNVARGAARILTESTQAVGPSPAQETSDPARSTGAMPGEGTSGVIFNCICREVHAYRPWETLRRSLDGGRNPLHLRVRTSALPELGRIDLYTFEFGAGGATLTVAEDHGDRRSRDGVHVVSWAEPFAVHERMFAIEPASTTLADLAGRTYEIAVESLDAATSRIWRGASVVPVGRWTDVVEIVYSAPTPHEAQSGANALAESYILFRKRRRLESVVASQEWLAVEVKRLTEKLEPLEEELDQYMRDKKAVLLSEQATSILERQINLFTTLEGLRREEERESARLERLRRAAQKGLEEQVVVLGPGGSNPMVDALFGRYADLRRDRAALLRGGHGEKSPLLEQRESEIQTIRAELGDILSLALSNATISQEDLLASIKAQVSSFKRELDRAESRLSELPDLERGLVRRKGEVVRTRLLLERYSERYMELKGAESSSDVAVTMVDKARLPSSRSSPKLFRMGLLGIFLGVLAGLGVAFFLDAIDHKVRSPRQLEEGTGLTVYASIPDHGSVPRRDRAADGSPLVAAEKPNSIVTEAYRSLRANVRFANEGRRIQSLAITSPLPREGKTTTTCNLGVVLAQAGSRTLIVDADMRRPATHTVFGGERSPGLCEILKDDVAWRDAITRTSVEGLSLICSGREVSNPGALLDSSTFAKFLSELKDEFDYILFDVPPVLAVADAASFFRSLDCILLLNRYGRCSVDVVDGAREQVQRLGGRLLGSVFNAFDIKRSARRGHGYHGYGGYYGYYAKYGYKSRGAEISSAAAAAKSGDSP